MADIKNAELMAHLPVPPHGGELPDQGGRGLRYQIEFDGFVGTVIGSYRRLDGEEGVVMQQDGTKVVHVYRRKWLVPADGASVSNDPGAAGKALAISEHLAKQVQGGGTLQWQDGNGRWLTPRDRETMLRILREDPTRTYRVVSAGMIDTEQTHPFWCHEQSHDRPRCLQQCAECADDAIRDRAAEAMPVEAESLLRLWQSHLGASREQCDESGRKLWDRIEATIGGVPPAQEPEQLQALAEISSFDLAREVLRLRAALGLQAVDPLAAAVDALQAAVLNGELPAACEDAADWLEKYRLEVAPLSRRAPTDGGQA